MGKVASAYDNALMESLFGSLQIELLERRTWSTRAQLANAIFEWIEAFYNPPGAIRRSTTSARSSSNVFTPPPRARQDHPTETVRETVVRSLWLETTIAIIPFAFGMLGVTNPVHLAAKIIYALLIAATSAILTHVTLRARSRT